MYIKVLSIVLNKFLDILFHCQTSQMTIGWLLKLKVAESFNHALSTVFVINHRWCVAQNRALAVNRKSNLKMTKHMKLY